MTTLLSSCCDTAYHVHKSWMTYVCDKCGKACDAYNADHDPIHNDKLMTRQCCDCAHVTGEMVEIAQRLNDWATLTSGDAKNLAELILETQKKEGK